jgi:hypothetical protein
MACGTASSARRLRRIAAAAAAVQFVLAGLTAGARAEPPALLDAKGVSLAAYGGWTAWSRVDASTGRYALVTRSPKGLISLAAVPERTSPFDVELGPSGRSAVAAVYSRCPAGAALEGCRLVMLRLSGAGAGETPLTPPGGGSAHEPAIWNGAIVFLRREPSSVGRRPDSLLAWRIGSRRVQSLPLPSSRGNAAAGWPKGLTGTVAGLSFNGQQVAYVTSNMVGPFGESTLWFEPLSGHPELIDQVTGGAGNVCAPTFVSPVLSGPWLYAYLHACDPTANPKLDRLTRYRRGEVQRASYSFIRSGDEAIGSAVPDGAGADWDTAGIERVARVSWRRIPAPVPQTFCGRSDPFC